MKIQKVIKVLGISKPTAYKLIKEGKLKASKSLVSNYWNFDDEDVFRLANKLEKRKVCVYARVSTLKQKQDLANQINKLVNYTNSIGFTVDQTFTDIASGISFDKRKNFFKLLNLVLAGKVTKVIITHKDRLSRIGFDIFKYLFDQFACEIVIMSNAGSVKQDGEEIFEDIIALLHCYAMKMYSQRLTKNVIEITKPNEEND
jgi:predicted site-specific integrase-resolvase